MLMRSWEWPVWSAVRPLVRPPPRSCPVSGPVSGLAGMGAAPDRGRSPALGSPTTRCAPCRAQAVVRKGGCRRVWPANGGFWARLLLLGAVPVDFRPRSLPDRILHPEGALVATSAPLPPHFCANSRPLPPNFRTTSAPPSRFDVADRYIAFAIIFVCARDCHPWPAQRTGHARLAQEAPVGRVRPGQRGVLRLPVPGISQVGGRRRRLC